MEQWVMEKAIKDDVLGSILGSKGWKVFFHVKLSLLHRLRIPICFMINQLTNKSRNSFNNGLSIETVEKRYFMRTDMFNKRIVT